MSLTAATGPDAEAILELGRYDTAAGQRELLAFRHGPTLPYTILDRLSADGSDARCVEINARNRDEAEGIGDDYLPRAKRRSAPLVKSPAPAVSGPQLGLFRD